MHDATSSQSPISNIPVSILAVIAGLVSGAILSLGTDVLLHRLNITPSLSTPWSNSQLVLATGYRIVFCVIGAWLTARLAPRKYMKHALILGWIGLVFGLLGAVATWNTPLAQGRHWYSIAIPLISLPCAWLGGKLRMSNPS